MEQTSTLKVCYVLKRYPRLSETFIVNEMTELRRQGVDITIVAHKDAGEEVVHDTAKALDVPVYYLSGAPSGPSRYAILRRREDIAVHPDRIAETPGLQPQSEERLMEEDKIRRQAAMVAPLMKSLGINHIHAHFATWATTAASLISDFTGIPFSFTAHAKDIYHESVDKSVLAEKIEKAGFVITVSDFNRRYLEGLIRDEGRRGRIIRLYNGIDLDRFRPSVEEKEANRIVGIGRLVQKKGFEYLIKACKVLNERGRSFQCIIIGEGEERNALEKMVIQFSLGDKVTLLGAQPQSEVKRILQKASVFVLPCIIGDDGNRDGLPTVLLEAMALGTPVISTRITGIPEIITHGKNGLLVEEKDTAALAEAIETVLKSPSLQGKFIRSAAVKVRKNFNITENVRTLKGYFYSEFKSDQLSHEDLDENTVSLS